MPMKYLKNVQLLAMSIALALAIVACGSSSTTGSSSPTPTVTGSNNVTPAATTGSASAVTLNTATLTVDGKSQTVLTNAQGITLYYRTSDTATSVCSGGCAGAWPPLLSSTVPTTSATLPGTFSLKSDANGSQVAYNGHLLYTFASDTAPGQVKGQGIGKVWFVATTDLAAVASTSGSSSTSYGYSH